MAGLRPARELYQCDAEAAAVKEHVNRSAYAAVPHAGEAELLEEGLPEQRTAHGPGQVQGRHLRIAGFVSIGGLAFLAAAATAWLGGPRQARDVASLRAVVAEHEHSEHRDCGSYEKNVDYRGMKVLSVLDKHPNSKLCSKSCDEKERCAAWTWGKLRDVFGLSDTCVLKEAVKGQKAEKYARFGFDSGVKSSLECIAKEEDQRPRILTGHIKVKDGICLEAVERSIQMAICTEGKGSQEWKVDEETGQVRNAEGLCLSAIDRSKPYASLEMYPCAAANWSQQWSHDEATGLVKNWRGACLDAGERNIDGGMLYIQTCNVNSTNQQWVIPASGVQPPQKHFSPGSLYCFALMLPGSYEQGLLAMQFKNKVSLFACNEYAVYSNKVVEVAPGVNSSVVNSDLKCGKGGEFGTALNLDIFIAVWTKVISEARFLLHEWTIKVDPDAVFFPDRLLKVLEIHPEAKEGVYLNNCKFGMHGPLEVFSRNAVTAWATGSPRCVQHFQKQCGGDCYWGEDLFVDQCLWKVLGVRRDNDFRLLLEDHCEPTPDWATCTESQRVAFHPFKTEAGYTGCLANASIAAIQKTEYKVASQGESFPSDKLQPASHQWHKSIELKPATHSEDSEDKDGEEHHGSTAPGRGDEAGQRKEGSSGKECHTAVKGEECYVAVEWARQYGFGSHPDWYKGLSADSSFKDFQANLHESPHVDCPMPCFDDSEHQHSEMSMH